MHGYIVNKISIMLQDKCNGLIFVFLIPY